MPGKSKTPINFYFPGENTEEEEKKLDKSKKAVLSWLRYEAVRISKYFG